MLFNAVSAQYTVSSLILEVYSDGYVRVTWEVIPEGYVTQVTVPLLGNHVENIIAEDENGTPLNYQVFGDGILVYVNNAGVVNVSYYTPDLTSKEGLVWTLNISVDEPFTVILPENAVIVDLSDIPLDISGDEITMPPGNQSVSYLLVFDEETTSSSRIPAAGKDKSGTLLYGTISLGIVLTLSAGVYFIRGRKTRKREGLTREEFEKRLRKLELSDEERKVLLYLYDHGRRASQAEVREALGIPKTTAWRMFQRLEKRGLVKILKGKKENWVELRF
ncbi:hypothetical protein A0127_09965 [Thermococcus peptonophilus]|uniref:Transcription regulator TrmB N-terminal domain-containing protein n=2 Tax=Thermococcus peptonophilus TaxID=53952 RepID=A0A142CXS2_9EURY|nr:hypothetical protein A0127_09965 [Thermococcus peptonophilus]